MLSLRDRTTRLRLRFSSVERLETGVHSAVSGNQTAESLIGGRAGLAFLLEQLQLVLGQKRLYLSVQALRMPRKSGLMPGPLRQFLTVRSSLAVLLLTLIPLSICC